MLGMVVFLVAVGWLLVCWGWRGSPILISPKCARCGYDVRGIDPATSPRCPECGNDLGAFGSVRFGEYRRRPWLMWAGGAVLIVGLLALIGMQLATAFRPSRRVVSNLAQTAAQPWDWQELERRYLAGRLSANEVSDAIDHLIAFLNTRPAGGGQPLHWSDRFLMIVDARGEIPRDQFGRLASAFYGPQPTIKMHSVARPGVPLRFDIDYGTAWNLPHYQLVKALRLVTVDGRECQLLDQGGNRENRPDQFSQTGPFPITGFVVQELPAGKYKLNFEIDLGLVTEGSSFKTLEGLPGQAKRWPTPRYTWSKTVTVPIEILKSDRPLISLVTDEKLNPSGNLRASAMAYRTKHKMLFRLQVSNSGPAASIPVVASITVTAGQEKAFITSVPLQAATTITTSADLPQLSPSVKTVSLTFQPDPVYAEREGRHDRIWGKPIVIKDVPLDRQDLDSAPGPEKSQ